VTAALTLAAAAWTTLRNERVYRLAIHGNANARVAVQADGPAGWLETFCTPHFCAIRHSVVRLSRDGEAVALLHVYRIRERSTRAALVRVRVTYDAAPMSSVVVRYLTMTLRDR
jgi:hypothetical protein